MTNYKYVSLIYKVAKLLNSLAYAKYYCKHIWGYTELSVI